MEGFRFPGEEAGYILVLHFLLVERTAETSDKPGRTEGTVCVGLE